MPHPHPRQSPHRQALRLHMTEHERILWRHLRHAFPRAGFRRQISLGPHIVDFASFKHSLVIELDGSQHVDSPADRIRDEWLTTRGFRVLRFWNREVVSNLDGVLDDILEAVT